MPAGVNTSIVLENSILMPQLPLNYNMMIYYAFFFLDATNTATPHIIRIIPPYVQTA